MAERPEPRHGSNNKQHKVQVAQPPEGDLANFFGGLIQMHHKQIFWEICDAEQDRFVESEPATVTITNHFMYSSFKGATLRKIHFYMDY